MAKRLAAMRTPADRMLPAERKKLTSMLVKFMNTVGAKLIRTHNDASVFNHETNITWYEYSLDTPLGSLAVHFTSDHEHLHCRFDDVPRALTVMVGSINKHSGKYNEYISQRCTAKYAFQEILLPHLRRIWIRAAQRIDRIDSDPFARYMRACAWMASFRTWTDAPDSITVMFGLKDVFHTIEQTILSCTRREQSLTNTDVSSSAA